MTTTRTLGQLAELSGATVLGNAAIPIERISAVDEAAVGSLTFAVDRSWLEKALRSAASAVIVAQPDSDVDRGDKSLVVAGDVRAALAAMLRAFAPPIPGGEFTDPSAIVESGVERGERVWIGPGVIVREDVTLGDDAVLMGGAYVGRGTTIGKRTLLHPRATVLHECVIGDDCILQAGCVIGSDGFGFVKVGQEHIKIPQIGNVIVGDRVEVGACSAIDRAVTGSTIIGAGTKIDNLVQIGHNVRIGDHCILCGQAGIAGSVTIGRSTTIAGQAGISGHIEIGEHSLVLGQAGVTHSLPPRSRVSGFPAQPHRATMEQQVLLRALPKLTKQVRALMDAVEELRKRQ